MKKILVILLCIVLLVSCSTASKAVEMEVVTQTVKDNTVFRDMSYEPEKQVTLDFYSITENVECYQVISATGATAEEIAFFKVEDENAVSDIIEKCETRKQERIDLYKDYRPDEVGILEDTQIFSKGDYVFYICADNDDEIKKEIETLFE